MHVTGLMGKIMDFPFLRQVVFWKIGDANWHCIAVECHRKTAEFRHFAPGIQFRRPTAL